MTDCPCTPTRLASPQAASALEPAGLCCRVWRSEAWRSGRMVCFVLGAVFCCPLGLVLVAMGGSDGQAGVILLAVGLGFLGVSILLGRCGREPYALRIDPSRHQLWVTRGGRHLEESSSAALVGFAVSEQTGRSFSPFTLVPVVTTTRRQLCYQKIGNPHLWPVAASSFATRQEARYILAGALRLLESASEKR